VRLIIDKVVGLDSEKRLVTLEKGEPLTYDYLIVATGSMPWPSDVPGLAEGGYHFHAEDQACRLRVALEDFNGGRIVVGVGGLPYKCPVAPLEFTFLLDEYLNKRKLRDKTEITYTFPLNRVFSIETVAAVAQPMLEQRGVKIETFFNPEEVLPEQRIVRSLEGTDLEYDMLVMVPPHRGAPFLQGNSIADAQGWVKTDRTTLQVKGQENIWALGDTTDLPISKAGSTAHFEASVIVEHVVGAVKGTKPEKAHAEYDGHVICFLDTGYNRASFLDFNYEHPPVVAEPTAMVHLQKMAFNRAYWYLVPTGVM
jgi:sulfide:quinone oxidoreductase